MFNIQGGLLTAGIVAFVGLASSTSSTHVLQVATPAPTDSVKVKTSHLPIRDSLAFEPNIGQGPDNADYIARGRGYSLLLSGDEAVFGMLHGTGGKQGSQADLLRMGLVGANAHAPAAPLSRQEGVSQYFIGNDPSKWHNNVARYSRVRYRNVYAGIDVDYYGTDGQLEYDFIVKPGENPGKIALRFDGADRVHLDNAGNLVLNTTHGQLIQHRPVAYQEIDGLRRTVAANYELRQGGKYVKFKLGAYDPSLPLVIDPVLVYGSYLGGNRNDRANAVAMDLAGNIYVAATTYSTAFPFNRFSGTQPNSGTDTFGDALLCKLRPDGATIVYCAYVGGFTGDGGQAVAVDRYGNAYMAGEASSSDFPLKNASETTGYGYLIKFNANATGVFFSTHIGDPASGIAIDEAGSTYIAGTTYSKTGIATAGAFDTVLNVDPTGPSNTDGFVMKYSADGKKIWGTYLGGSFDDRANAIAIDAAGNSYVAGETESVDYPVKTPIQSGLGGEEDAFVTKINPQGKALVYSTFIGGNYDETATGIAVNSSGRTYVVGETDSSTSSGTSSFPIVAQIPGAPLGNAFISAIQPAGNAFLFSSRYYNSYLTGIAIDSSNNIIVTGYSYNGNVVGSVIPVVGGVGHSESQYAYYTDSYVAKFDPAARKTLFSSFFGSNISTPGYNHDDEASAIAVNKWGDIVIVGYTEGDNLRTVAPFQPGNATPFSETSDREDGFVARFSPAQSVWQGDFNGDHKSDLFYRNGATGENSIWYSANSGTAATVTALTDLSWRIVGVGDFNGDGRDDIVWRNPVIGQNVIWYSGNFATRAQLANLFGNDWRVGAVADFNGDGHDDILWHNSSTAANVIWRSGSVSSPQSVTAVTNLAWDIVGAGDFNGDHKADIVWRNASTGQNAIWLSGNSGSQLSIATLSDPEWRIAGTGDYNGDGKSDVLWRHMRTGANTIWRSGNYQASTPVTTVPTQWELEGQGDYNGDGKADMLLHNKATGANAIWRSASSASSQAVTTVSNLDWRPLL